MVTWQSQLHFYWGAVRKSLKVTIQIPTDFQRGLVHRLQIAGHAEQQAQMGIYSIVNPAWDFQVQQNLNADLFSNYMATPTPFDGGSNNSTYTMVSGWNSTAWADAYSYVMSQVQSVFKNGQAYPDFIAWARIIRVEAMHRVSDIYGPIIYTHYGSVNADGSVTYDSQKDAYYAFFADLDSAITVLTPLRKVMRNPALLILIIRTVVVMLNG